MATRMLTYLGHNIIRLLLEEDIVGWNDHVEDYAISDMAHRRRLPPELLPVTWSIRAPVLLHTPGDAKSTGPQARWMIE